MHSLIAKIMFQMLKAFSASIAIYIYMYCVCGVISLLPASAHGPSAIPMKQLGAGLQTGLLKLTTLKPFKMCFGEVWFGSTSSQQAWGELGSTNTMC